jgi:ubiquinone/menaquinone biosynthesis C-methylase UbiE
MELAVLHRRFRHRAGRTLDGEQMHMRNWVYHLLISRATHACYGNCLDYFPAGSRVLDVGIGNGFMIEEFHPLIRAKALHITGIDIDAGYLRHCRSLIDKYGLEDYMDLCLGAVESFDFGAQRCFDFVLFSMSFMLLNDQRAVLQRVRDWLRPGGEIVFVQAMFKRRSHLADLVKPRLKYLTTVDFGRATYEAEFFALLRESNLSVQDDRLLVREPLRSQCRMIVASWPTDAVVGAASHPDGRSPAARFARQFLPRV